MYSLTKKYGISIIILLMAIYYLFYRLNYRSFFAAFKYTNFYYIFIALSLIALGFVFAALKINYLLDRKSTPKILYNMQILGTGLSTLLPFKTGDALKIIYLKNHSTISFAGGMRGVFWERFFDINFLILVGIIASHLVHIKLLTFSFIGLASTVWLIFLLNRMKPSILNIFIRFLPHHKLQNMVHHFLYLLRTKHYSFNTYLLSGIFTVLGWLTLYGVFYLVIKKIVPTHLAYIQIFNIFAISALGWSLPSTPGAIGVYESAIVLSLSLYGVPKSQALVIAILIRCIQSIPPVLYTVILLHYNPTSLQLLKTQLTDQSEES